MLRLRGGVSFLVRLPSTCARGGALAGGIRARSRVCLITLSRPSRWLPVAACLPLYALAFLAEAVRAVKGVWRCCILESYLAWISGLGAWSGSGDLSMSYRSTMPSARRLFNSAALSACCLAFCRGSFPGTGMGLYCSFLSASRACQLLCAPAEPKIPTGECCARGGDGVAGTPGAEGPGGPGGPGGP